MSQSTAVQPTQPARGLLRSWSDLDGLTPGEYLECHACNAEYDRADLARLQTSGRDDVLCDCGVSGFIRRGGRQRTVQERRPMLSGLFYPSALELREHGDRLGLDGIDRLFIEAIDDFPAGWDLTYEQIATTAGVTTSKGNPAAHRVKATLAKLRNYVDADGNPRPLVVTEHVYFHGKRTGVRYDLTPLWEALAGVTKGEIDPKPSGDIHPNPLDRTSPKSHSAEPEALWNAHGGLSDVLDDASEEPETDGTAPPDASPQGDATADDPWTPAMVLDCYVHAVCGEGHPGPAITATDKRLAAQLIADGREWDDDLDDVFLWALFEPFWSPKVRVSFATFARSLAEIERQAAERPLRECRCWDSFVPTRAQQRTIETWGNEADVECPACQTRYEAAA